MFIIVMWFDLYDISYYITIKLFTVIIVLLFNAPELMYKNMSMHFGCMNITITHTDLILLERLELHSGYGVMPLYN